MKDKRALRDRWAWFKSFFTKDMVVTGRSFTSGDASSAETILNLEPASARLLAHYVPVENESYILEGISRKQNRVVYTLFHLKSKKKFSLPKEVFELLFRLR